jgi:hypothetical protein
MQASELAIETKAKKEVPSIASRRHIDTSGCHNGTLGLGARDIGR